MLDRFVFRRDDVDDSNPFPDESRAPLRASSCTSDGKRFDVAFLPVDPPAISRFYVRWPGGTKPEDGKGTDLVAADRDLVLFRLASVEKLDTNPYLLLHTQDHFILRASVSDPEGPQLELKRLPVCTIPLVLPPCTEGGEEIVMQRVFFPNTVGLVRSLGRNSEEEFAVAQLAMVSPIPGKRMMEAEVCVLRSHVSAADGDDGTWEVKKIPIQHEKYEYMDLNYWSTDDVISFKNCICWVSYHRGGILFYEVLEERPKISYLRLPINDRPYSSSTCQAFPEMNRSVCVTSGGDVLKFIDVTRSDTRIYRSIRPRFNFFITSHTLRTTESSEMDWYWDAKITSSELWARSTDLPHDTLMFPLVSMEAPHVVHFLLSEKRDEINKVSVVTIDILNKTVNSIVPYVKGEEDLCGEDADLVREKSHLLKSFLPSEFPKFLNLTRDCIGHI